MVTCYPLNGAAYPGNEYFLHILTTLAAAAACCSAIAQLHNTMINNYILKNVAFYSPSHYKAPQALEKPKENVQAKQTELQPTTIQPEKPQTGIVAGIKNFGTRVASYIRSFIPSWLTPKRAAIGAGVAGGRGTLYYYLYAGKTAAKPAYIK